ncbi:MAG: two-component system, chemotaxis family, protein-glutamate methylesterase/glutaminase [Acidobacteriaceae bacterium]|jgi:two-component system chemotaxis response regulator CheB|nr:two-component system, chemotaxis family, protein-glutamate methylesterase/glutaminase [Acidobacteriaceae bacterium]
MTANALKKIRVLIVDDSAFMRKVLETILITDENVQVVGHAKDGREAVRLSESLKPDVITMDINMPVMDGLQATAEIMTTNPRPIVVVSSESRQGAASTLRALELGAIEFVAKPSSGIDLDMHSVREDLLRKVRLASKVRVVRSASRIASAITNADGKANSQPPVPASRLAAQATNDQRFPVVVLAASTGGPATVMRLAPGFTRDFPAAVILVQHMPAAFTTQYATQLAEFTGVRVKEAENNETLTPGTFYICPGGQHLRVMPTGRIQLDGSSGRINGYLPNIDITMESVAAFAGPWGIGVILTGMGNDGTGGASAIKSAGGMVLAQDEATSVIFGMPAEAIKAGAVSQVLGIDDIYAAIEKQVLAISRIATVGVR